MGRVVLNSFFLLKRLIIEAGECRENAVVLTVDPFRRVLVVWADSGKDKQQRNQDDCNRQQPLEVHGKEQGGKEDRERERGLKKEGRRVGDAEGEEVEKGEEGARSRRLAVIKPIQWHTLLWRMLEEPAKRSGAIFTPFTPLPATRRTRGSVMIGHRDSWFAVRDRGLADSGPS